MFFKIIAIVDILVSFENKNKRLKGNRNKKIQWDNSA